MAELVPVKRAGIYREWTKAELDSCRCAFALGGEAWLAWITKYKEHPFDRVREA